SISGSLSPLWSNASPSVQAGLALLSLGFAVIGVWGQLAISALAIDPAIGRDAGRVATARLLPAIGVYVLLFVVLGLLMVPTGVILLAGGVDLARLGAAGTLPADLPAGTMAAAALYVLLLVIALLFVG